MATKLSNHPTKGPHHGLRALLGLPFILAITMIAVACGSEGVPIAAAPAAEAESTEAPPAPPAGPSATIGSSDLGELLVGSNGLTLYGFTNDVDAASTCSGTCAEAWPPVIVDADFAVAPGLDVGIFATTVRDDGQFQLVAGKWPLYFFAGDAVPGDITGQGSGDVWFAVAPDGSLITDDAAAPVEPEQAAAVSVSVGDTDEGQVLVDGAGLSLYGFLEDVDATPTCNDACADAWPPVIVGSADLPADLDPAVFSVVARADGQFQLAAGVWPLYRFAGDAAPGDINGQNSGDVWFLATPEGGLIREASGGEAQADDAPAEADTDDGY